MTDMNLLDFNAVSRKVSLSRKTIYSRIRAGDFPKQVKVGRASRWLQHEVDEWIARLAEAR
ncbi:AlpA family phage regulatory protein [Pseudomonas sp. 32.2.56]|uniref:helix-turn-helix transcriptional regulator n=1 Tax=Pseudomonas sp. 32.2.56 TaxID=2969303 RepID=UPI0027E2B3E1|nr:AlpA family phage regulatory protein [Pseudomonas sp. 32.2.56]